jgi:hypothetical protein
MYKLYFSLKFCEVTEDIVFLLESVLWIFLSFTLFGCSYQHGLLAVVQCFSLTTKQLQPAYKPQKQPAEQSDYVLYNIVPLVLIYYYIF